MTEKLDKELQRDVDKINLTNAGKVLIAESKLVEDFTKKRKPVLNREGQDILGAELQALNASFRIVIKHINDRLLEIEKLNKEEK